ncbi:MAG: DNA repair exonuclease, partial [Nitriliruptoraceae bacterium]
MVRFLHTSDWQLGMTRHFLIGSEAQERFSQDRIDAIGALADVAREHACAFVVVAGDVFDTNQPQRRTLERALEALASFDVPVYLLPGNHDHQGAESVYRHEAFATRCPAHVEILDDDPRTPMAGVEVVGAPWTSNHPLEDLVTRRCRTLKPSGTVRVVVGHGQVDDVVGDHGELATIRLADLEAAMRETNVAYVALGDRHSALAVGETGRVWYSGAPEATDYRDGGPG